MDSSQTSEKRGAMKNSCAGVCAGGRRPPPSQRRQCEVALLRALQDADSLRDGLLLLVPAARPLGKVLDEHVAGCSNLGQVAREGLNLLLVGLEVRLELRERELGRLQLGGVAVAGVDKVGPALLVSGRGRLEVRNGLRLLGLEVLHSGLEVLARVLQNLHDM